MVARSIGEDRVVPFQIAVHDGEEDLEKQVDGIYEDRDKVEPCFARHHEWVGDCTSSRVYFWVVVLIAMARLRARE